MPIVSAIIPAYNGVSRYLNQAIESVLAAYGFSSTKDLLAQLVALNTEVARRIDAGETVVGPGIPPTEPSAAHIITTDCLHTSGWTT